MLSVHMAFRPLSHDPWYLKLKIGHNSVFCFAAYVSPTKIGSLIGMALFTFSSCLPLLFLLHMEWSGVP